MLRRGGGAAATLGLSGTPEAAMALVDAVERRDRKGARGELQRQTMRGVYEGLDHLVRGPQPMKGPPPVATLTRALHQLGRNDRDSPTHLLSGLAVAAPREALPLLLRLEDSTLHTRSVIAAAGVCPLPEAAALLRRLALSDDNDTHTKALEALVLREGVAALPFWLAVKVARGETDGLRVPHTIDKHGLNPFTLPKTADDLRTWLAEQGLPTEVSIELPIEERVTEAHARRPLRDTKAHLLADLQAMYRTKDLRYAAAVAVGAAGLGVASWSDDPALDWADPEGMGLAELADRKPVDRLEAVLARPDLPEQILPAWMKALADVGRLVPGVRQRIGGYDLFSKEERAELVAAEQAWRATMEASHAGPATTSGE